MKFLVLTLFVAFNANAKIIESNKYAEVLQHLSSDTLFVTDLDNTVMRPPQTLGSDQWGTALQKDLISKGYTKAQASDIGVGLFALIQLSTSEVAVETETPSILQEIARKGIPTLGLTARPLNIVDRTLEQLKSINAKFTGLSGIADLSFASGTVAYKGGVLFVGPSNNKGTILKQALEQNGLHQIRKIVFIDDKAHHTQEIESAFSEAGYAVVAIRYGATDELVKSFDPALGQKELEIYGKTGRVVSDVEAAAAF